MEVHGAGIPIQISALAGVRASDLSLRSPATQLLDHRAPLLEFRCDCSVLLCLQAIRLQLHSEWCSSVRCNVAILERRVTEIDGDEGLDERSGNI